MLVYSVLVKRTCIRGKLANNHVPHNSDLFKPFHDDEEKKKKTRKKESK